MKDYFDFLKYLVIALIAYLIGMILENPFFTAQRKVDTNKIVHFQEVLHKKEVQIEKVLNDISDSLKSDRFTTSNSLLFVNYDYNRLAESGLGFLIFKNDTLVFWSDNSIPIKRLYDENNFNDIIHKFPNAWYEIRIKQVGYYKIVGLIKIKNTYPFNNKYLKDEYQKDYGLPPNVKISSFIVSNSFKIRDKEGDIIMCLIPHGTIITEDYVLPSLLYLISILYLSLFLLKFLFFLIEKDKKIFVFIFIIIAFIFRILSIKYRFPQNLYSLNLFSAKYYAITTFFNTFHSLGDFFANVLLIYISYIAIIKSLERSKSSFAKINFFAGYISLGIMFFFNNFLIKSIIKNSSLQLNLVNIIDFRFVDYVALIDIFLTAFLFIISSYIFIKIYKQNTVKYHIFGAIASALAFIFLDLIFHNQKLYYVFYLIVLHSVLVLYIKIRRISVLYFYLILVNVLTLYLTDLIIYHNRLKQEQKAKLLITQVFSERDNIAEMLFKDIVPYFSNDNNIIKYLTKYKPPKSEEKITQYLEMRYFKGYWKKYLINVKICDEHDSLNFIPCISRYREMFQNYGIKFDTSLNVYYVKDKEGKKFYLIKEVYQFPQKKDVHLYIKLSPKLYPQNIGYPELLIDASIKINKFPENYSYAEYSNDVLIIKHGEYNYPLYGSILFKNIPDYKFIVQNKWKHTVLHTGKVYYVLSYKKMSFFSKIITYSYIFIGINLFFAFLFLFTFGFRYFKIRALNFRAKFVIIIFSLLLISFLIVALVTFNFNLKQFRQKHYDDIRDKLNSITLELKYTYRNRDSLPTYWQESKPNALIYKIHHLAEVFNNDINLYSVRGELIATSRPKIFTENIIGRKINMQALHNILFLKETEFVHKEKIGGLNFFSAYKPLLNKDNRILAIVNLPYFANSEKFHKRQTNLLATLLNIYAVLFVFSIILGIFLAEQIIAPLNLLANKFEKLEIGKYEKIEYKRKDEIGQLIQAYNEMVEKLYENIKLLKKSERESAWRDMARQIAHEIKNPLTPMQLSMQMLLRSWENKDEHFEERLKDTAKTLIEQIDVLKKIAQQFGDFAKIPQPKEKKLDIVAMLKNIMTLFSNNENIDFIDNLPHESVFIKADEEFINRIFINLIKNAIQAIPKDRRGKIEIGLKLLQNEVLIYVRDNGIGISDDIKDKLFTPHFTTKSSGMGIGLNMVKNLTEAMNGKVWFESELDKGTIFYIKFPIYANANN